MNALNPIALAHAVTAALPVGWNVIEGGASLPEDMPGAPTVEEAAATANLIAAAEFEIVTKPAQFSIARDVITQAISDLARVVERRNSIPILSNVMLAASGGILVASATDLDCQISIMAECEGEFAATVPAHMLKDVLTKGADSTTAEFRANADCDVVNVSWGKLLYRLQALPTADFPTLAPGEFSHRFTMSGKSFRDMVEVTMRSVSTEETRYYLNGLYLHAPDVGNSNRPEFRMVATDGHRLYRCDADLPDGAADMPGVIFPRGAAKLFLDLTKGKRCPGDVQIDVGATHIRLTFGNTEILSKLIDGTFPDYQRVIPTGNDMVGTFNAKEFIAALDSVTVISSERGRAVKLVLEETQGWLRVDNPDAGSASMEIACTLAKAGESSPYLEIGYNAVYLKSLFTDLLADGGEIIAEFGDAGSPAVFRSGRADFMAVLMPMRI